MPSLIARLSQADSAWLCGGDDGCRLAGSPDLSCPLGKVVEEDIDIGKDDQREKGRSGQAADEANGPSGVGRKGRIGLR